MKLFSVLLILCSSVAGATTNQIDFTWGRTSPLSSVQAGGTSESQGLRGSSWSVDALHRISPHILFGAGSGKFHSEDNSTATFLANYRSTISSKVTTALMVLGRADLGGGSKFTPYAVAGVGWVKNSLTITAIPSTTWANTGTTESRTIMDDSKDAFGYLAGVGIDAALGDRWLIGVETRYQGSTSNHFAWNSDGQTITGQTGFSAALSMFSVALKAGIKY